MKKYILVLSFITFFLNSLVCQTPQKQKNKTNQNQRNSTPQKISIPKRNDTFFWWEDGMKKIVKVNFIEDKSIIYADTTRQKLIMTLMIKSEFKIINKLTATPKSLTLVKSNDLYGAVVNYYAKNNFGVLKDLTFTYSFDTNGVITEY